MIAFGDIHGHARAAETAIRLAERLNTQAIFLGDYVDRGIYSMQTLLILIDAKQKHPDWVFLRGNHEQMLLDLIERRYLVDDEVPLEDGTCYLMKQTQVTYVQWRNASETEKFAVHMFLQSLPYYYETARLIFTHAVLRDTRQELSAKTEEELLWNYDYRPLWRGRQFVHGHSPVDAAIRRYSGYNINTKCGYGGHLTGLYIENEDIDQSTIYTIKEDGILVP